mmetsp:Transcript_10856/g.18216  ORF Transcript_10856/g.18216 Transcript_10856/m.18216 type:complete len:95 (+) Transcript_10856:322-606(+)
MSFGVVSTPETLELLSPHPDCGRYSMSYDSSLASPYSLLIANWSRHGLGARIHALQEPDPLRVLFGGELQRPKLRWQLVGSGAWERGGSFPVSA